MSEKLTCAFVVRLGLFLIMSKLSQSWDDDCHERTSGGVQVLLITNRAKYDFVLDV